MDDPLPLPQPMHQYVTIPILLLEHLLSDTNRLVGRGHDPVTTYQERADLRQALRDARNAV